MLENHEIKTVFIIGSGPIVIGQAGEFDYSGTQACKALKNVGYRVILLNSNPATIMTDPEMADAIYIDSIDCDTIDKILTKEKPDALLTTMGGQTALNCSMELYRKGILTKHNIKLIGADQHVIAKAESRDKFRQAMLHIGLDIPKGYIAKNITDARKHQKQIGFPIVIRPSYALGGSGGGIAFNKKEFLEICSRGFAESIIHEVLLEESLLGWKEFELEVIRDRKNNCIVVCTIENIDPLGIHTGDSITVAPAQTLTDKQYQKMRDAAFLVLREIGVEIGGANVQFAIDPKTGRQVVIEMNPRVSRSSALASKATGFPIAKIAALLAVGFTLDQIKNDITGGISAVFEPAVDYIAVKIPRFNFEKFPKHHGILTTQMKSVGEVMAIGRTFQAAFQKALNSLELGISGLGYNQFQQKVPAIKLIRKQLKYPDTLRVLYIAEAFRVGLTLEEIHKITSIDRWYLYQLYELVILEQDICKVRLNQIAKKQLLLWKQKGFSDLRLAKLLHTRPDLVRKKRINLGIKPVYKRVDSCAAEFRAITSYLYSSYDYECEANPSNNKKIIILGGGPNRIGQGVEFDYCCVKALQTLKAMGLEAIMINCNPETVSTDYDMADKLYFEPITIEAVLDIIELEKPWGVILQFGGQTPLMLARYLHNANIKILGTDFATIELTEDRGRFSTVIQQLKLKQPKNSFVNALKEAKKVVNDLQFPLIVRPSYVLGGNSMKIVRNEKELIKTWQTTQTMAEGSILLEQYLENATEVDVDVISDKDSEFMIAGIMENIEPAGVHSGDSSCVLPTITLSKEVVETIENYTAILIKNLKITGLANIQFAVYKGEVYVLEVNPRASRTIPFISKAYHKNYVEIATKCLLGMTLDEQKIKKTHTFSKPYFCVKHAVIPFNKFPDVVLKLEPEMHATGEVMGIDTSFLKAYKKSHNGLINVSLLPIVNIFIECSIKEAVLFINTLQLLQHQSVKKINIYCGSSLAEFLQKNRVRVKVIKQHKIVTKHNLRVVILTRNGNNYERLVNPLSKHAIKNNSVYALNIYTAKVILSALLIPNMYNTLSTKEWQDYLD